MSRRLLQFSAMAVVLSAGLWLLGCSEDPAGDSNPELQLRLTPPGDGSASLLRLTGDTPEGTIQISSRGTAPLVLGQAVLGERTAEGQFALRILQDSCSGRSLDPGHICIVVLRSENQDCEQAAVQIGTNDPQAPTVRVAVQYVTLRC